MIPTNLLLMYYFVLHQGNHNEEWNHFDVHFAGNSKSYWSVSFPVQSCSRWQYLAFESSTLAQWWVSYLWSAFCFRVLEGLFFRKLLYSVGCRSLSGSKETKRHDTAVSTFTFRFLSSPLRFSEPVFFFHLLGVQGFISVRKVPEKAFRVIRLDGRTCRWVVEKMFIATFWKTLHGFLLFSSSSLTESCPFC